AAKSGSIKEMNVCRNDADNVTATLKACDFSVTRVEDNNDDESLATQINSFITRVPKAKLVFIYFSGHCFVSGTNCYITDRRLSNSERTSLSINYILTNVDLAAPPESEQIVFLQSYFKANDCSETTVKNFRKWFNAELMYTNKSYIFSPAINQVD